MADKKISALPAATTPLAGTEVLPIVQGGTTDQVSVANLTAGRAVSAAQLDVDNIRLDANTISTTNTNGNLTLDPNGSGYTILAAPTNGTITHMGDLNSRTFYMKQANVGGFDNDTLIFESDSGVGQFQWKNSGATLWSMNAAGNLVPATAGKGIDFSANANAPGMTSELLTWYEEGTWTPSYSGWTTNPTSVFAKYTRIGRVVIINYTGENGVSLAGVSEIGGLPFTSNSQQGASVAMKDISGSSPGVTAFGSVGASATKIGSMTSATFTGLYWSFTATYIV